jgi:hypothetical protein
MRWRRLGLCVVAALGVGCPETYGIGGSIDEAVEKDMKAMSEELVLPCPSRAEAEKLCANPRDKRCRKECL